MTSHQDVDEKVKITDFQDAGLLQRKQEKLASIMETLEEMESKFESSFQKIDDAFRDLNIEIDVGNRRFSGLVNEIRTNFNDFERKRKPPIFSVIEEEEEEEEEDEDEDDDGELWVSTIFQTFPNLFNVRLSCKPKCEMRQITCKILCLLFGFNRNEAHQSLIIILIKPTSCLYIRRLCTNE